MSSMRGFTSAETKEETTTMPKGQIVIHMEGGLIQEILSPGPVEVYVYETGEEEGDEERLVQWDGEMVYLDKWEIQPQTGEEGQKALSLFHKLQDLWEAEKTFICAVWGKEAGNLCSACGVCGNCCACIVFLIASGYEWTCSICKTLNSMVEALLKVTCQGCGKSYDVDSCDHA